MTKDFLLVFLLFVMPVFADHHEDAIKELDQSLLKLVERYNKHDGKGVAQMYTKDAMQMHSTGQYVKGREAIEEDLSTYFEENPDVRIKNSDVIRHFVKPDVVIEDGKWEMLGQSNKSLPTIGRYSAVLVRSDGEWLIAAEHSFIPRTTIGQNEESVARLIDYDLLLNWDEDDCLARFDKSFGKPASDNSWDVRLEFPFNGAKRRKVYEVKYETERAIISRVAVVAGATWAEQNKVPLRPENIKFTMWIPAIDDSAINETVLVVTDMSEKIDSLLVRREFERLNEAGVASFVTKDKVEMQIRSCALDPTPIELVSLKPPKEGWQPLSVTLGFPHVAPR